MSFIKKVPRIKKFNKASSDFLRKKKITKNILHNKKPKRNFFSLNTMLKKYYIKFFQRGITIKTAMDKSLEKDKNRCRLHLKAISIGHVGDGAFSFNVQSSGISPEPSYVTTIHFFNLKKTLFKSGKITDRKLDKILEKSKIKIECRCKHFTYRLRYIATLGKWVYGRHETRFPRITNKHIKGICCKHLIRTLQMADTKSFKSIFYRHSENLMKGIQTRLTQDEKNKSLQTSWAKT